MYMLLYYLKYERIDDDKKKKWRTHSVSSH